MTCIRRESSTWTACRCPRCLAIRRRVDGLRQLGSLPPHDPTAAHRRVAAWLAAGYEPAWIASACGIPVRCIQDIATRRRRGQTLRLGRRRTAAILAADITTGAAARGPATGSTRRVQALAALGWTIAHIADAAGVSPMTVSYLQRDRHRLIGWRHARSIAAAYTRLCMTPGPSQVTRDRAAAAGWAPPLAWDDIDDPASTPWRDERDPHERHYDAQRRVDLDDLDLLASDGHTVATAAARLGVDADTIRQACRRHQRGDLVARLERNGLVAS